MYLLYELYPPASLCEAMRAGKLYKLYKLISLYTKKALSNSCFNSKRIFGNFKLWNTILICICTQNLAQAVFAIQEGKVKCTPGCDGGFGKIEVKVEPGEAAQTSLF
jgi:hypothetical protein